MSVGLGNLQTAMIPPSILTNNAASTFQGALEVFKKVYGDSVRVAQPLSFPA